MTKEKHESSMLGDYTQSTRAEIQVHSTLKQDSISKGKVSGMKNELVQSINMCRPGIT